MSKARFSIFLPSAPFVGRGTDGAWNIPIFLAQWIALLFCLALAVGYASTVQAQGQGQGQTLPKAAGAQRSTELQQLEKSPTAATPDLVGMAATSRSISDGTIADRMVACTVCHGKEGRATNNGYFPRIAGKPAGYLYHQLLNIRDGRRQYEPMASLLENLTDDYLQEMAGYFAGLDIAYPAPQTTGSPAALLEAGRRLVREGDATRGLPACVQCHGAAMTGVRPDIPGLLGLPRDYLNGQLGAWKTGQRHAQAPDCMGEVASRLTPADVEAVSTWLSSQPLPADTHPAAGLPARLPLACGGVAIEALAP